jgi:acetyl esterase/lipase
MHGSQNKSTTTHACGHRAACSGWLAALVATALCAGQTNARADPVVERLYPGVAPGSEQWTEREVARMNDKGGTVYENVAEPTMAVYAPISPPQQGAAVVLLPGGALRVLVVDDDLRNVISTLNTHGLTVFLLKYRVLQRSAASAAASQPVRKTPVAAPSLPHVVIRNANANPFPDDLALTNVLQLAAADTQVALRRVRGEADRWHINPAHVGVLGYSAGGGVALAVEQLGVAGARPDFIATAYGPSLMDVHVSPDASPLFIATETLHGPVTEGLLALASLWRDAGRPVEMHMYDVPAFAMPSTLWVDRFLEWLGSHQLLPAGVRS